MTPNDKRCHRFDVFNWFAESRAVRVYGCGDRSVVRPDPTAPPCCSVCDRVNRYRRRSADTAAFDILPHFGADVALIRELRGFCDGAPPTVSVHEEPEATRLMVAALQSMDGGGVTVEVEEIPNADV